MRQLIRHTVATICAGVSLFAAEPVLAQDHWPSRAITFLVPFPPGGTTDLMGRAVAQEISKALKQPVMVENRAGANGAIGSAAVAGAAPDGYTFLISGIGSNAINHGLYDKLRYDSSKDFVHVSQLISGPNVLVANVDAPFKTFQELLAYAKAHPGKLSYASSGNGASGHLAMELLKQSAGIDMQHVPYKGGAPALQDVLGGQVPLMFINQDIPAPHVRAGKLRAIAVADTKRNPLYPETPTLHELGLTDFSAVSWVGLSAPKGTPAPIVERMHAEVVKALNTPVLKAKLEEQGFRVVASTAKQYGDFVRSETDRWTRVIKTANIRME
jgi:tripartite-type tricarboxylate transporter receptor subunit TctC